MKHKLNPMQSKKLGKYIAIGTLLFAINACTKPAAETPQPSEPQGFSKLEVASNFDWKNSKTVTINVTGLPTNEPIRSTLTMSRHSGGNEDFYAGSHLMSENVSVTLRIPAAQDSLIVRFGTVQKTISVKTRTVTVDYLPTIEPDIP
jgi:hypothetical protein